MKAVRRKTRGRQRPAGRPSSPARWTGALPRYFSSHAQAMVASLGRIWRTPLANTLTVMVIAIAIALPGTLLVLLDNLERVTGGWNAGASLTLFLKPDITATAAAELKQRLLPEHEAIESITLQDPDQALEEFRRLSGFSGELKSLTRNPLPTVMIVTVKQDYSGAEPAGWPKFWAGLHRSISCNSIWNGYSAWKP